jgi:hypothetical protein
LLEYHNLGSVTASPEFLGEISRLLETSNSALIVNDLTHWNSPQKSLGFENWLQAARLVMHDNSLPVEPAAEATDVSQKTVDHIDVIAPATERGDPGCSIRLRPSLLGAGDQPAALPDPAGFSEKIPKTRPRRRLSRSSTPDKSEQQVTNYQTTP